MMVKRVVDLKTSPTPIRHVRSKAASPFVGREEELQRLAAALALAADGLGGVILLTGEPGIGKTRLAREALAVARERGFTVLEGMAYPLEAGLAYAPLVDAFRPLLCNMDPSRLQSLASELPSLGHLFEGLRLPPASLSEGLGDPALEKTRLFEAVLRLLQRLTREAPVVLFIDDLHSADPATLDLLHYLARGLPDQAALLLVAYRADSLDSSRRLRELVEPLQRAGLAEEIALNHLETDAAGKLIRGILGGDVPKGLVALLDARAGGTPLFIEALIDSLIRSGNLERGPSEKDGWVLNAEGATGLPDNVRRLILERLDRLSATQRRVLDLLAIMGDPTSHAILRAASDLEEETLLGALRPLRAAGLLADGIDGSDVTYGITHPLIQEVAYAELPEMERRCAHLVAIRALESSSEGQPNAVSRLARHYRGAGPEADPERALAALVAAGERALFLYANEEAARHLEAALAIARRRGPTDQLVGQNEPLVPWLLERLGEALERIGKPEAAVDAWNQALVLVSEGAGRAVLSDTRTVATCRLSGRLAIVEWQRGHFDTAIAHLKVGLAVLAGREPCQELVDLHFVRFTILSRLGDVAGVADTIGELLSLSKRLASPRAEGQANLAASFFHLWQNDVAGARERALHALVVGEQAQELEVCCHACAALAAIGMRMGEHIVVRMRAERGLAMAQRLGDPTLEVVLLEYLAFANFLSGSWVESSRCCMEAIALARRVGHQRDLANALAERAMVLALRGDLSEAGACIAEAKLAIGDSSNAELPDRAAFAFIDIVEAALALEQGQVERALGIAKRFSRPQALTTGTPTALVMASMPMGLALLGEAQVAAGEPESALETTRQLIGLGPANSKYLTAFASRVEGLARKALGQPEAELACMIQSHEEFNALEIPFEAARSLLEQGAAAGHLQPEVAVSAFRQSLEVFDRLGAERYATRARRLLRALGVSSPGAHRAHRKGVLLSDRELEVVRMAADGLSRSEIAERLTISRRTVDSHLSNIYLRLGIRSHLALVRYLIDSNLL